MAKQGMGKSMGNRECHWIRARLPLWVVRGDEHGGHETHGERGDLSGRERRHIERHLALCPACREYRASLDQALGALAIAATQLPVWSEAPSLWPALERRIADRNAHPVARRPKPDRGASDRSPRSWGDFAGTHSSRPPGTHDTIGDAVAGRDRWQPRSRRWAGLILKVGVAAAVLVAFAGLSVVRQQWTNAQSTILANALPLAEPVVAPTAPDEPPREVVDRDKVDVPANQLAEAEPPRPAEAPTVGIDAAVAPKSPPNTRFGFDLEHGTPMPPDSRDAKPVY
jgi:hypothetical protein